MYLHILSKHLFYTLLFSCSFFSTDSVEDDIFTNLKGPVKSCLVTIKQDVHETSIPYKMIAAGIRAVYDKEGRIIQRNHEAKYGSILDEVVFYYYDEDGKLEKEVTSRGTYKTESGQYEYDMKNYLTLKKIPDGKIEYDYNRREITARSFLLDKIQYTLITTFDVHERIIEEKLFNSNDAHYLTVSYLYHNNQNIKEKIAKNHLANTERISKYNKDGNIVEEVLSKNGKDFQWHYFTYTNYDRYGNWTERQDFSKHYITGKKNLVSVETRTIEYYDE